MFDLNHLPDPHMRMRLIHHTRLDYRPDCFNLRFSDGLGRAPDADYRIHSRCGQDWEPRSNIEVTKQIAWKQGYLHGFNSISGGPLAFVAWQEDFVAFVAKGLLHHPFKT